MPPRKKRSKIDVKLNTELLQNKSYISNNTDTDTRSSKQQKEPSQLLLLSNDDILNQAVVSKIFHTDVKDKNIEREKMESPEILPLKDSNSKTIGKLSDSNIQVAQECSLSEASAIEIKFNDDKFTENSDYQIKLERSENLALDTKIDSLTEFESYVESSKVSPFLYKRTLINEDLLKITRQGLKDENNGHEVVKNNELNTEDNLVDNQSLVSQKVHEIVSTVNSGASIYNISETNESKTKDLTPPNNDLLTSSNTVLTECLQETENLPNVTNIRVPKMYHNTGESIEHKDSATIVHLRASSIKKIKDKELTDQVQLKQMRTFQAQQLKSTIINYLKRKHTNVIHESEIENNNYEDDHQKQITSSVESETEERYDLSETDKNKLNLKPLASSGSVILTSCISEFPEHLLDTEVSPQATKPIIIYKHIMESIEHNKAATISCSQASIVIQTQVTDVTGQENEENITTSQALVDTITNNYKEKNYLNDLHGIENVHNIECKDDISILTTAGKEPLKNNLSSTEENEIKLKSLTQLDDTSFIVTTSPVSTTGKKYEEKNYITDLSGIDTVNNIESRNYKDDHLISTKSSSRINIAKSGYSMISVNLTMNSPNTMDSKIISDKETTKAMSQVTSTVRMSDKEIVHENFINNENSLAINQSLSLPTSLDLSPALVLQEKESVESHTQEKNKNNEEPVHHKYRYGLASSRIQNLSSSFNLPNRSATPSSHLQFYNHEDEGLNSRISFKSQMFKENNGDGHSSSAGNSFRLKLQESFDNVMLETIPQLQSKISKVISVISDTEKERHSAHDSVDTIEKDLNSQPKVSESDSDVKPINLNITEDNFGHLRAAFTNEGNNEFMKINKSELDENFDENKKSSIHVDFGFHFFKDDKKGTLIRTYDTKKHLKFGPLDTITVIKSTIRANDSEIRIPITSETDITLKLKKTFNEGAEKYCYILFNQL